MTPLAGKSFSITIDHASPYEVSFNAPQHGESYGDIISSHSVIFDIGGEDGAWQWTADDQGNLWVSGSYLLYYEQNGTQLSEAFVSLGKVVNIWENEMNGWLVNTSCRVNDLSELKDGVNPCEVSWHNIQEMKNARQWTAVPATSEPPVQDLGSSKGGCLFPGISKLF